MTIPRQITVLTALLALAIGALSPTTANASTPDLQGRSGRSIAVQGTLTFDTSPNPCTTDQQNAVGPALAQASTYLNDVETYMDAGLHGPRFTWWFGAYDSARFQSIATKFTAIRNVVDNHDLTIHCDMSQAENYGYVYPNTADHIYLGPAFFRAANAGTDSRAGTLIGLISKLNAVAGNQDWAYGQSAAHDLNIPNSSPYLPYDPTHAPSNADNYEYFAENNPTIQASLTASTPTDFGSVERGSQSATQQVTITSSGPTSLDLTGTSVTGDFGITADTCSGASLVQNATCTVTIAFAPTASGARTGTLSLQGNYDVTPATIALSGTGTITAAAPAGSSSGSGSVTSPTSTPAPTPSPTTSEPTTPLLPAIAPVTPAPSPTSISRAQAAALTATSIASYSSADLSSMSRSAVAALRPEVLRALTRQQLTVLARVGSGLHPSQVIHLRPAQIRQLKQAQLRALKLDALTQWLTASQHQAVLRVLRQA